MRIVDASSVPAVTGEQMREADRIAIEDLGINLLQMMENAGRVLAELAIEVFAPASVAVLAGAGANGGGALVAARHLANRAVATTVVFTGPDRVSGVPAVQLEILRRMGAELAPDPQPGHLVVDGLIGYGLRGNPAGRAAELIAWANAQSSPTLSLDVPSGLDATTGRVGDPCVRAAATLTLALPKTGLALAPERVGDLYLADISVPPAVFRRFGLDAEGLFAQDALLHLR